MLRPGDVPDVFEIDGSWRDLYVVDTTIEDWKEMLGLVRDRKAINYEFTMEGEAAAIPQRPEPVFISGEGAYPDAASLPWSLVVTLDGLDLTCLFLTNTEIEFHLDPRNLNENRLYELLDFMESLGRRLKKDVLLTPENGKDRPIVKYDARHDRIVKAAEEKRKESEG